MRILSLPTKAEYSRSSFISITAETGDPIECPLLAQILFIATRSDNVLLKMMSLPVASHAPVQEE